MPDSCPTPSLLDLLGAAHAGDDKALDEFLVRIQEPVLRFLRRRLREPRMELFVEDVLAEVLVRVYRYHHQCLAQDERSIMAWVLTIAKNEALRLLERNALQYGVLLGDRDPAQIRKKRPGRWQEPPSADTYTTEAQTRHSLGADALLEVLRDVESQLNRDLCRLLYLRLIEKWSWLEIGDRLGTTESGAKRRFQRAQAALARSVLEAIEDLPEDRRRAAKQFLERAAE